MASGDSENPRDAVERNVRYMSGRGVYKFKPGAALGAVVDGLRASSTDLFDRNLYFVTSTGERLDVSDRHKVIEDDLTVVRDGFIEGAEEAIEAVGIDGLDLRFAVKELRDRKDVVLAAVRQNGLALEYASSRLRRDREVISEAIAQNGRALKYVREPYRSDEAIQLLAVRQEPTALSFARNASHETTLAAVEGNGLALKYVPPCFTHNRELVLAAVSQNGEALRYAHWALRRDRDVVRAAVRRSARAIDFAHSKLRRDPEFSELSATMERLWSDTESSGSWTPRRSPLAARSEAMRGLRPETDGALDP